MELYDKTKKLITQRKVSYFVTDPYILTFESFESFCLNAHRISNQTPIYVDVNLGNGVLGTAIAIKLHNMGYKQIYLATGYEADGVNDIPPCVIAVCGKDPFFAKYPSIINSNRVHCHPV